jgi:hypothetical protein
MNAEEQQHFLSQGWAIWREKADPDRLLGALKRGGLLGSHHLTDLIADADARGIDIGPELAYYGISAALPARSAASASSQARGAQPLERPNAGPTTRAEFIEWTKGLEAPWHHKLCEMGAPLSCRRIAKAILGLAVANGQREVNLANRRLRGVTGANATTITRAINWLLENGFIKLVSRADRSKMHAAVYRLNMMGEPGTLDPVDIPGLDLAGEIVARALVGGCTDNPSALERATGLSRRTCERASAAVWAALEGAQTGAQSGAQTGAQTESTLL